MLWLQLLPGVLPIPTLIAFASIWTACRLSFACLAYAMQRCEIQRFVIRVPIPSGLLRITTFSLKCSSTRMRTDFHAVGSGKFEPSKKDDAQVTYSCRKASHGSIFVARRDGIQAAKSAASKRISRELLRIKGF